MDATVGSCTSPTCEAKVRLCQNAVDYDVCSGAVDAAFGDNERCRYCSLNSIVPNAANDAQLSQWTALERAKHRALFGIENAGFSIEPPTDPAWPVLQFAFISPQNGETVTTGHANGLITINAEEADSVARERNRIELDEPKRTLTAHIRHELGHYFWDRLVKPARLTEFRNLFGDEQSPPYAEAQQRYYANGPAPDWQHRVVSRYASMHPWEDFAETFRVYTEMSSVLATAASFGYFAIDLTSFETMLASYRRYGVFANEINREIGLTDVVPERFSPPVVDKLRFVHQLR